MSRAAEHQAQYRSKIALAGQWIAIRRYSGAGAARTFTDTCAPAYIRYTGSTEFVGAVTQNDLMAITIVDTLTSLLPITTNDRLVTDFYGWEDLPTPPSLDEASHVSGGKETAIKSVAKRVLNGALIALELHAVG
jgi:hypothetical protein